MGCKSIVKVELLKVERRIVMKSRTNPIRGLNQKGSGGGALQTSEKKMRPFAPKRLAQHDGRSDGNYQGVLYLRKIRERG